MNHDARSHSKHGASSAHRWFRCPGSIREIERAGPAPESPYAKEGTYAHEVLEACLAPLVLGASEALNPFSFVGKRLGAQVDLVSEEMAGAVAVAVDHVVDILSEHPDAQLFVETSFKLPTSVVEDAFGTNDVCIWIPSLQLLIVIDFKYGAGVAVEVVDNEQLQYYGLGAIHHLAVDCDSILLTVIQPRCFHVDGPVRSWSRSGSDLRIFFGDLESHILKTLRSDAPLVPGDKQCNFCDARWRCPALEKQALQAAGGHFADVREISADTLPNVDAMDAARLSYIKAAAPLLRKWLEAVEARAKMLAHEGHKLPGFKLVEARAQREIIGDPEHVAEFLSLVTGVDRAELFRYELRGITAVEAAVLDAAGREAKTKKQKMKLRADAKEALAFICDKKSSGALTLVSEEDSRPGVTPLQMAFQGVVIPDQEK